MNTQTDKSEKRIYSCYIINKAGVYRWGRNFFENQEKKENRDQIISIISSFHGFSTVASQIHPMLKESSEIQQIRSTNFSLQCLHTDTDVKFLVIATPSSTNLSEFLNAVYKAYTDYVVKNPFQVAEMPIKSMKFENEVKRLVTEYNAQ